MNNFYLKGDFKLNNDGLDKRPNSRQSNSRQKQASKEKNRSLVNAGKNIAETPIPDMLDEEMSKRILKEFAAQIPPSASIKSEKKGFSKEQSHMKLPPKHKNNLPQSEGDLLTSMATRLKAVEITCKNQREQIRQKTQTMQKLKSENTFLKAFRDDANKEYQKMKALQSENAAFKKKVEEMETYLKKYGLKWVGDKLEGKLEADKMKQAIAKGNYQYRLPSEIDINTIGLRINDLNAGLHSEGKGTQIYSENGVHKFRKAEPLPIGFFANGIAIKGYKFFPYKSKESLQILGDLIDGYFPYVLKAKYPNGVFLKVVDKLVERYDNQSSTDSICTFQSNQNNEFKPPSKQQFLQKLPKSVMQNGKVINIRGEIQKRLNGQSDKIEQQPQDEQNQTYQKSEGITVFKTTAHRRIQKKEISEEDTCTLKIRNEQGDVFILHLQKESLISDVYHWMKKVTKNTFKVMSNFPRRSYEPTEPENLETLGFHPNAMLHIQCSAK